MPLSKRRKKNGKKVGNGTDKQRMRAGKLQEMAESYNLLNQIEAGLLAEAAAELENDPALAEVQVDVPLYIGEGEDRRQIGTAAPIDGDPEHMSIHVTDTEVAKQVFPLDNISIDKENK